MPLRILTDAENELVARLKEYWENHKHFLATSLDCCGFLDIIERRKFESEQYIGKLALKVATAVCIAPEDEWNKFLSKHGINNVFSFCDTSDYISIVFRAIQKVDITTNQEESLQKAINIAKNPNYKNLAAKRLSLVNEYSEVRNKKHILKLNA